MISRLINDIKLIRNEAKDKNDFFSRASDIKKNNNELITQLARLRLPEAVFFISNWKPTDFPELQEEITEIKPFYTLSGTKEGFDKDYSIEQLERKILPYADKKVTNWLGSYYNEKLHVVEDSLKQIIIDISSINSERESLNKEISETEINISKEEENKNNDEELQRLNSRLQTVTKEIDDVIVHDEQVANLNNEISKLKQEHKESNKNEISELKKKLNHRKTELKEAESLNGKVLELKNLRQKIIDKQNALGKLKKIQNDHKSRLDKKDIDLEKKEEELKAIVLERDKINSSIKIIEEYLIGYEERYKNILNEIEKFEVNSSDDFDKLFAVYLNNHSDVDFDKYLHLKTSPIRTARFFECFNQSDSERKVDAFIELVKDGFIESTYNRQHLELLNIYISKELMQAILTNCVNEFTKGKEIDNNSKVLSLFKSLACITTKGVHPYVITEDSAFWNHLDSDELLDMILYEYFTTFGPRDMIELLVKIFLLADADLEEGALRKLARHLLIFGINRNSEIEFDIGAFCNRLFNVAKGLKGARIIIEELVRNSKKISSELKKKEAYFDNYFEKDLLKELIKVLYLPLEDLEKTATNFVSSKEPAEVAVKHIMKDISKLRKSLEGIGIHPIADVSDWLNQNVISIDPEVHHIPEGGQVELVRLRSLGIESDSVKHLAYVDPKVEKNIKE
jgi:hypothetical protein